MPFNLSTCLLKTPKERRQSMNNSPNDQRMTLDLEECDTRIGSDLLQRCSVLLAELEQFEKYLAKEKSEIGVELRHFKGSVETEYKSLERLCKADPTEARTAHTLRSSNFPFYAAVWDVAKGCSGVIALGKRFHWMPGRQPKSSKGCQPGIGSRHKRFNALVDIVAQDGLEWVKVSTVTEKRILFDLAKAGWVDDLSSEGDDEGDLALVNDDQPGGLLKQAESLVKASRVTMIRYRHPNIRIVLPRIKKGYTKEVDLLLERISSLGIIVQTSEDLKEPPAVVTVLKELAVDPFAAFSDVINLDCTVLLALVSDLSHSPVVAEDWHHRAVLRQIEMEQVDQLLPNSLWPACGSRGMVCTKQAARRMHEIVDLIGTETEKLRAKYLIHVETMELSRHQRIQGYQILSTHTVPQDWKLPVEVIDVDLPAITPHLPPVSEEVTKCLSPINQSVFLYGWAAQRTTISSNRTVAKEIVSAIEARRLSESDIGPHIWLCPTARSLVGKEKNRRS